MLLIDALNTGGGAMVLLDYLTEELDKAQVDFVLLENRHNNFVDQARGAARTVKPVSLERSRILNRSIQQFPNANLLSFGNIPAIANKGVRRQFTYFHNALILPSSQQLKLPIKARLRYALLCICVRMLRSKTDYWIVQTKFYADELSRSFGIPDDRIKVFPFFRTEFADDLFPDSTGQHYDLLYVSSNSPHKNHINLLKALKLCATRGYFPHLALTCTLNVSLELRRLKSECLDAGARITEIDGLTNDECISLTRRSRAVIFPSLVETVGLGLIEAGILEKPVLAPDVPWIADVIRPSLSFDPLSPSSMAKAIIHFMNASQVPLPEIVIKNRITQLIRFLST